MFYHIDKLLGCMLLLFGFDHLISKRTKSRWFSLHTFGNMIVTITSLSGFIETLRDPMNAANSEVWPDSTSLCSPASVIPTVMINAIHLYHILFFKLNKIDVFHHALFIPLIGMPGQIFEWGVAKNFLTIAISGFPGGIDYFNLVLVKHKKMSKIKQKHISSFLNLWIRAPIICFSVFINYNAYIYDKTNVPLLFNIITGVLAFYNAFYYLDSSIRSDERHKNIKKLPIQVIDQKQNKIN